MYLGAQLVFHFVKLKRHFIKDKNSNIILDKDIGKIKILLSLNVQLKMRHKATEYIKYNASKRIHYDLYF